MSKIFVYGNEARERVLCGVQKLTRAVATTMGPYGRNVLIGKFAGAPSITKDGVSVAREVVLEDPIEELGCQILKEVSGRTADIAGDGTTTATVLASEIFENGLSLINQGYNPLLFRDGINLTLSLLLKELDKMSKPVTSFSDIKSIATISANNDESLGDSIAKAFDHVNMVGVVTAEAAPGEESYVRLSDGIELRSGYITPAFVLQNEDPIVMENPLILVCERDITHVQDFITLLGEIHEKNRPLLIIAKSVKQEALNTLIVNRRNGRLNAVAVEIPALGKRNDEWLFDLSILVGTRVFGEDSGNPLSSATVSSLGEAKKVKITKYATTIIDGRKDLSAIRERESVYKEALNNIISDSDRKDITERLSFLQSKAAVVCVGYSTEAELREKGDRVEDAVCATKAAISSGILPGGGVALFKSAQGLDLSQIDPKYHPAARVLLDACARPLRQIVYNSYRDPEPILEKISAHKDSWFGYNLATDQFGNMMELGVLDPKKVTKTALQNAVSATLLLINTDAIMAENPERPSGWQPPAGWRPPSDKNLNHKY